MKLVNGENNLYILQVIFAQIIPLNFRFYKLSAIAWYIDYKRCIMFPRMIHNRIWLRWNILLKSANNLPLLCSDEILIEPPLKDGYHCIGLTNDITFGKVQNEKLQNFWIHLAVMRRSNSSDPTYGDTVKPLKTDIP